MRRLPYAKALEKRRAAGDDPWLVIVSVGGEDVRSRRPRLKLGPDTSFVRVPGDLRPSEADWRVFVALDVLLVREPDCAQPQLQAVCGQLWAARVASLWMLCEHYPDGVARACDVYPFRGSRQAIEFHWALSCGRRVDHRFREMVKAARDVSLLVGEPPLFSDPMWNSARDDLCRSIYGERCPAELAT